MKSWPLKYRLLSFFITIGVTSLEFVLFAIPIGLILWLANASTGRAIVIVMAVLAATFSLSISISTHIWPQKHRTAASRGVS